MLNKLFAAAAGALLLAVPVFAQAPAPATHSQKVIIETDMGNDIDDALALTVALNAVRDGKLDLMMVSNHKKSPTASEFIDIVNTYYGYPEIEVAACSTPVFHGAYTDYTVPVACDRSWRRSGKYEGDYPDAVARYREVLASCADGEVVITNNGKPTALMIDISDGSFEATLKAVKQAKAMIAFNSMRQKAASNGFMSDEEIEAEIAAARRGE